MVNESQLPLTQEQVTYQEWMLALDLVLIKSIGIDAESMGDFASRDAYDDGATVAEGLEALRDAVDMPDDVWAMVPKLTRTAPAVRRKKKRTIRDIAREIRRAWHKPNFAAVPYLNAMQSLETVNDRFGLDDARSIIVYFLSNASTFRGDDARRIKAELNALVK